VFAAVIIIQLGVRIALLRWGGGGSERPLNNVAQQHIWGLIGVKGGSVLSACVAFSALADVNLFLWQMLLKREKEISPRRVAEL